MRNHVRFILAIAAVLTAYPYFSFAWENKELDREGQREFLLHADVVRHERIGKGITNPYRLTLSDGTVTHDAAFQPVQNRRNYEKFADGRTEINFVDSYFYNIAAYRLAEILELDHMMPVTVERKWNGMAGSLSWWLPILMDEGERMEKDINPPDIGTYNKQIYNMRVFSELIYDTDRNAGNVLIGEDWKVYMIDFTRAFRLHHQLKDEENLEQCSRKLFTRLQTLDPDTLRTAAGDFLNDGEIEAVMGRRDRIVEIFNKLIAEKGENDILF